MSVTHADHPRFFAPFGAVLWRLVAKARSERPSKAGEQLFEDLERIASTAPHLLNDIGFECDRKASSSEETIFCKGAVRVVISALDGSVSIQRG